MTKTRYTIAALLQYFGVGRKTKWLTDASSEMHLMHDGEEILGAFCWKNVEEIEELAMEYWNLRRLERKGNAIIEKIGHAEKKLIEAQQERAGLLERSKDVGKELLEEREVIFGQIEELNARRDAIMDEAIQTKRKHSALKMKAEVLKEENIDDGETIQQCRADLIKLRETFNSEKEKLSEINAKTAGLEKTLKEVQDKINSKLQGSKGEASEAFARISDANRDITHYRSQLGLIQNEQALLFSDVGRFLNINARREDCRRACRDHRGIQEQTRLLYQSIEMNRRLAKRVGA